MRSDPSAAAALYENAALRIIPPRLRNQRVGVGEKNATLCGRKLPSLFLHPDLQPSGQGVVASSCC